MDRDVGDMREKKKDVREEEDRMPGVWEELSKTVVE